MALRQDGIIAACADTLFPPAGAIPISGTEADIVAYVDEYLRGLSWVERLGLRLLFLFIQLSPLVFGPRFTFFTRLSAEDRKRVLQDMEDGKIFFVRRDLFFAIKLILTMGYEAHAGVDAYITKKRREGALS